jgi:hypothetical protein
MITQLSFLPDNDHEPRPGAPAATLVERCAALGWSLHPDNDGWILIGNGAPAAFRSTDGLTDWLEHQERALARGQRKAA